MLFKRRKCEQCDAYYDPTLKECPTCHKNNAEYGKRDISRNVLYLHPVAQGGLFLIGFAWAGMLAARYIMALVVRGMPDSDFRNVIYMLLVYSMMFVGLLTLTLVTRRGAFFDKFKRPVDYLYGIGYAFTVLAAGTIIGGILSLFHPTADNTNQQAIESLAGSYPIIMLLIVGFIGPICEEFTYRVGLYSFLRRINKYLAFAVTVIVFALIHFDFTATGEDLINELWALPSYIVSGFVLTLAYEHRGPACSMVAHAVYNTIALLLTFIQMYGK